jgi:hypothetical protein
MRVPVRMHKARPYFPCFRCAVTVALPMPEFSVSTWSMMTMVTYGFLLRAFLRRTALLSPSAKRQGRA